MANGKITGNADNINNTLQKDYNAKISIANNIKNNPMIKKISNMAWHEFVYGGHMLSFGTASIALTSAIILDIQITWGFFLTSYLLSHTIYTYNRYKEFKDDSLTNSARTQHIENYIKYLPYAIFLFALIAAYIFAFYANPQTFFLGFFILTGGLLYTDYFKKFTRRIIGLKSFYVSFFWSLLAIFAALYYELPLDLSIFFLLSFIFLRFMVSTIFFDIKDIESDQKDGLKTFPVLLGKEKTLAWLHVANLISFFPLAVGIWMNFLPLYSLSLLVFYFYTFYYLKKSLDKSTDIQNLSYIMVDGEYLLWPIITLCGKLTYNLWRI